MDKKKLRRQIKEQVLALTRAEQSAQSLQIVEHVKALIEERKPRVVALFSPLKDEVQILPLAESLPASCRVVLPRVGDRADGTPEMEFFDYEPTALADGAYGIAEPQGESVCAADEIDLMVVPGVAFTREGARLGRGKGYYDRYLSREGFRAYTVGVCYACQLLQELPSEEHDRRVDIVVAGE